MSEKVVGTVDCRGWRLVGDMVLDGREEAAIRVVGRLKLRCWRGCGVSEVGWKTGSLEVRG